MLLEGDRDNNNNENKKVDPVIIELDDNNNIVKQSIKTYRAYIKVLLEQLVDKLIR